MELNTFIMIAGFIILVLTTIWQWSRTNNIESNCIATLKSEVLELQRQKTAIWEKLDSYAKENTDHYQEITARLVRLETKINGFK